MSKKYDMYLLNMWMLAVPFLISRLQSIYISTEITYRLRDSGQDWITKERQTGSYRWMGPRLEWEDQTGSGREDGVQKRIWEGKAKTKGHLKECMAT